MTIRRWVTIGFESSFGASAPSKYYLDPNRVSLESPGNPFVLYPGSSRRGQRYLVPSAYIPQGDIDTVVDTWRSPVLMKAIAPDINYQQHSPDKSSTTTALDGDHSAGSTQLTVASSTGFSQDDIIQVGSDFGGSELHKVTSVSTGQITISDGLTRTHNDDADVSKLDSSAQYLHIVDIGGSDTDLDSVTIRAAKDFDAQVFSGCVVSQLSLSIGYNTLAGLTASIVAQKDAVEAVPSLPASAFGSAPFAGHQLTSAKLLNTDNPGTDDKDIGSYLRTAEITINNNVQGENGLRMGSRFPVELKSGELEVTASLTLGFRNRDQYQDFWGGAGPGNGAPKARNIELKLAQGTDLLELYTYNSFLTTPVSEVSGRDMIVQTLEYQTIQREPEGANGVMAAFRLQNSKEFRYS